MKNAKKVLAIFMVVCMLPLSYFAFAPSAVAEIDESLSKEDISYSTLEDLGFSDLKEDGDFELNPTMTKEYTSLYEVNELYVNLNTDYSSGTIIRDKLGFANKSFDDNPNGSVKQYGYTGTSLSQKNGNSIGMWGTSTTYNNISKSSSNIAYATSTEFAGSNGKKDYVASLQIVPTENARAKFDIYVNVEKFGATGILQSFRTKIDTITQSNAPGLCAGLYDDFQIHEYDALVEINAGDYDGDGNTELAFYYGTNSIYFYRVNEKSKSISKISAMTIAGASTSTDDFQKNFRTGGKNVAVTMASGDFDMDFKAEIAVGVYFYLPDSSSENQTQADNTYAYVFDMAGGSTGFTKAFEYKLTDQGDNVMRAVNVAAGDITGDRYPELIIAGYTQAKADLHKRANWKQYKVIPVLMKNGRYTATAEQTKSVRDAGHYMSYYSNEYGIYAAPIGLAVANMGDLGTSDRICIFVDETLYGVDVSSGSYSLTDISDPYMNYWSDPYYKDNSNPDQRQRWVSSVKVGNFDGNLEGRQQVFVVLGSRSKGDTKRYWFQTCVFKYNKNGSLSKDYEMAVVESIAKDMGKDCLAVGPYFSIAAPDVDEDSIKMKLLDVTSLYAKPKVNAIIQSAPYFEELAELSNGSYPSDSSTSFTMYDGDGGSGAFHVGGSVGIVGQVEVSAKIAMEAQLGMGIAFEFDYSHEWSDVFSKTYTANAGDDFVVLYTMPVNEYHYSAHYPASYEMKIPGTNKFNSYSTYAQALAAARAEENYGVSTESFTLYENWVALNEENLGSPETIWSKGYKPGTTAPDANFYMVIEEPLRACTTMITVDKYDEIASKTNGLEVIRDNLLYNTPGDPYSYNITPSNYKKILDIGPGSTVNNSGGAFIENTYTHEETDSFEFMGTFYTEGSVMIGGGLAGNNVMAGVATSFEIGGGGSYYNVSGTEFNYGVENVPSSLPGVNTAAYSFSWAPKKAVATLNGGEVQVLYYVVSNVKAPPAMPQNLSISDVDSESITITWDEKAGAAYYDIYNVVNGQELFLKSVKSSSDRNGVGEYVATGLESSTSYTFKIRSVNDYGKKSAFTNPVTASTLSSGSANFGISKQPEDCETAANTYTMFTCEAYPAENAHYQWQYYDEGSHNWVNMDGKRSSVLRFTASSSDDGKQYRCTVYSNANNIINSLPAKLVIGKSQTEGSLTMKNGTKTLASGSTVKAFGEKTTYSQETVTSVKDLSIKYDSNDLDIYYTEKDKYVTDLSASDSVLGYDKANEKSYNAKISNSNGKYSLTNVSEATKPSMQKIYTLQPTDFNNKTYKFRAYFLSVIEYETPVKQACYLGEGLTEPIELEVVSLATGNNIRDLDTGSTMATLTRIYNCSDGNSYFIVSDSNGLSHAFELEIEEVLGYSLGNSTLKQVIFLYPVKYVSTETIDIPDTVTYDGDIVKFNANYKTTAEGTNITLGKAYFNIRNIETNESFTLPAKCVSGTWTADYKFYKEGVYEVTGYFGGSSLYRTYETASQLLYVTVNPNIASYNKLTISGGTITVGESIKLNPTMFTNNVGSAASGVTYTVKIGSTSYSGLISNDTFTPKKSGTYTITASKNGYTASTQVKVNKIDVTVKGNSVSAPCNSASKDKQALLGFTVSGPVGNDWDNNVIKVTSTGTSATTKGSYPIVPSFNTSATNYSAVNAKYNVKFINGTLNLEDASYKVNVDNDGKGIESIVFTVNKEGAEEQYASNGDYIAGGSEVVVSVVPKTGYTFSAWQENGTNKSTDNLYVIDNLTKDVNLKATYNPVAYSKYYVVDYGTITTSYTSNPFNANPTITGDTVLGKGKDYTIDYYEIGTNGIIGNKINEPVNVGKYLFVINIIGSATNNGYGFEGGVPGNITGQNAENFVAQYKCSNILTIKDAAHTHYYTSNVTTSPTCTVKGVKTFTCSCGDSYTEEIPAKGHSFGEWQDITAETCDGTSYSSRTCADCSYEEKINMHTQGHTWDNKFTVDKEADCETDGSKSVHCTKCQATQFNEVISAKGHTAGEWEVTLEPTETNAGEKVRKCTVCGKEIVTEVIEPLGVPHTHSYTSEVTVEATCTAEGLKTYTCECGDYYTVDVPATGHVMGEWYEVKADVCLETSYSERVCTVCGEFKETINEHPEAHAWEDSFTVDKEATCTETGSKSIHCSKCSATMYNDVIPAKGHTAGTWEVKVEATKTTTGLKVKNCTVCNAEVDRDIIPATGGTSSGTEDDNPVHTHSFNAVVTAYPSCTNKGVRTYICSCGENYTVDIPANGHSYGEWITVGATACNEEGYEKRICSVCGVTETKGNEVADHIWDETYTVDKAATCTTEGSKSIHCSRCDATKDSTTIAMTAHKFSSWKVTKASTYFETGTAKRSCTVCGKEEVKSVAVKTVAQAKIKNNPGTKKLGYKYSIILTAETATLPKEFHYEWFANNVKISDGPSITFSKLTKDQKVELRVVYSDGRIMSTDKETIDVDTTFVGKITSFFTRLFKGQQTLTQSIQNID